MNQATDSQCRICTADLVADANFCTRCGAITTAPSAAMQFDYRLIVIRRLLQVAPSAMLTIARPLEKEVAYATQLAGRHPHVVQDCRIGIAALASQLKSLRRIRSLWHRCKLYNLCVGLLDDSSYVEEHQHAAGLAELVNDLRATESALNAGSRIDVAKFNAGIGKCATDLGESVSRVVRSIYAAPAPWLTVARTLDKERLDQNLKKLEVDLAWNDLSNGQFQLAMNRFQEAVLDSSEDPWIHAGIAQCYLRSDDMPVALEHYRRAIKCGTRCPTTLNNFAWHLVTNGKASSQELSEAMQVAELAVDLAPIGMTFDTLAEVHHRLGNIGCAIQAARHALLNDPDKEAYQERMEKLCGEAAQRFPAHTDAVGGFVAGEGAMVCDDVELDTPIRDSKGRSWWPFSANKDREVDKAEQQPSVEHDCEQFGADIDDHDYGFNDADGDSFESPSPDAFDEDFSDESFDADPTPSTSSPSAPIQAATQTPLTDAVQFTVASPTAMIAAESYLLDVWAHLPEDRQDILEMAKQTVGEDISVKNKAGVRVSRGTTLLIELSLPEFEIEESREELYWDGDATNALFVISVPSNAATKKHVGKVKVFHGPNQIATIPIVVTVAEQEIRTPTPARSARCFNSAFASYASEDRDAVLGRIQGLQTALPHLDIFLDVASLRSGESWQERLTHEVGSRDVFYLFWSKAANDSEWVQREWRLALQNRGIEYINPIPLASPKDVPPPPELGGQLHFNDWMLAYMSR